MDIVSPPSASPSPPSPLLTPHVPLMRWGSIWPGFGSPRRIRRDIGGNNSPGREYTQAPLYRPLISNLRAQAVRQRSAGELRTHKRQCEMELEPSSLFFSVCQKFAAYRNMKLFFLPPPPPPSLPPPLPNPSPHLFIYARHVQSLARGQRVTLLQVLREPRFDPRCGLLRRLTVTVECC